MSDPDPDKRPPCPVRNAEWPSINASTSDEVNAFLQEQSELHCVWIPSEQVNGNASAIYDWLREHYGSPMIEKVDPGRLDYYWCEGRWVGIVDRYIHPTGRNYYFVDQDEAFEFKMRWR